MTENTAAKILLVDDKPENLIVLEKLLSDVDAEFYKATSGNQALALTLEHDFVVILLDVQMPGMNGYEMLEMLSWEEKTKYIPVIFITANYADEQQELKGYKCGAVDFLFKPINQQILLGKVNVFLDLYHQRVQYKELNQRYQLILNAAGEGVIGLDDNGNINFSNPAASKLLNHDSEELNKKHFLQLMPGTNKSNLDKEWANSDILGNCKVGKVYTKHDELFSKGNLEELPVEYTATPLHNEKNQFLGLVVVFSDITLRKTVEKQLTHLALYDHLTQLPNRLLFEKTINQAMARAQRHHRIFALMFLDLDHFKNINDTLGHDTGDLLLKGVSARLKTCIRESDTVARLGGDEFAIVLDELENPEDAAIIAEKIIDSLKPPFLLNNHEVFVSTSIGVAIYPISGEDTVMLTKNADIAMYRTKQQGRNNYLFFTSGMNEKSMQRLNLAHDLRHAIARNEFFLCYQPKLDLKTNQVIGLEALLRWNHPQLGIILPADFIPIAEEISLIVNIGEWVLKTACLKSKTWLEKHPELKRIAVNLSGSQLIQNNLLTTIQAALDKAQLPADCLEIELTETSVMTSTKPAVSALEKIHNLGIHISVDDFGTGYSSLSHLKTLPVDSLKIDESFVHNLTTDSNDAAIVKAIIALAHNMELKVTAEGVETKKQLDFLVEHGCDQIQGFYFSGPLTADELTEFLTKQES